ncbi:hypothetical protein CKX96_00340 [Staphylococcus argenteus]|nr:hypothetical protein CJ017_12055 [Staphylococcus argenteus]ATZ88453.1 hypothetical protein CKO49_12055 [Staphylococcus argenteus]KAA0801783.1 hypothetical protein DVU64_04205 [Staphylococcus argenteus]MZG25595.1 hypothetical protein [Staphylococcus argenteus]PSH09223.1 hypothetical protein CKX96_00340 [Staphylococcus argenteus]
MLLRYCEKYKKIICDNYTPIKIIVKFIFCKSAKTITKLVFLKFWIYNIMYIDKQTGSDNYDR